MGRMNSYQYNIGSRSLVGKPTWNSNGTLETLAITDPFNSSDQQTCSYTYDDLARLASANCGSIWDETFSYDAFGNISKTAISGALSWQPTYNTSTNQYSTLPTTTPTYDANGDVTWDGFHNYTWDADGNPATLGPEICPGQFCQYTGNTTGVFDALDRPVEENYNNGQAILQEVYGADGKGLGIWNGQTLAWSRELVPGGGMPVYVGGANGPTLAYYFHPDWLGSIRFVSDPNHNMLTDEAYAPFGEQYAVNGVQQSIFTGQWPMFQWDYYDFPFRELHPIQGRWLTPDPADLAAVDPANPQSWNRYAYVLNNPLALVDPLGLFGYCPWGDAYNGCLPAPGGGGGGGGSGGGGPCSQFVGIVHPEANCGTPPAIGGGGGGGGGAGNAVPVNPCAQAGRAPAPDQYAAEGLTALALETSPLAGPTPLVPNIAGALMDLSNLASFRGGGSLDAQAYGASPAYANYVFGVYMNAAGFSLPQTLSAANAYASLFSTYPLGTPMGPNYPATPAANVANITNGFNAEQNGTTCQVTPQPQG